MFENNQTHLTFLIKLSLLQEIDGLGLEFMTLVMDLNV
jgi:hypothetical protein